MEKQPDSLGLLLHEASRNIRKAFERRVDHMGLSSSQWRLLLVITKCGQATQARIADHLDIEPISVSRMIDRMEAAGWVERRPDPDDRRAKIVTPTDRAVAAHAVIRGLADEVYAEALAGLSAEQRQTLLSGLSTVIANLNEAAARTPVAAQGVSVK
ncbi:MAG: MarR family transcriptional regulator [Paracoccaceae bacterium]